MAKAHLETEAEWLSRAQNGRQQLPVVVALHREHAAVAAAVLVAPDRGVEATLPSTHTKLTTGRMSFRRGLSVLEGTDISLHIVKVATGTLGSRIIPEAAFRSPPSRPGNGRVTSGCSTT